MRFDASVDLRRHRRRLPDLALERRLLPFQHEPLADAIDAVDVQAERRGDLAAGERPARAVAVGEQQHLRVPHLLHRRVPVAADLREPFALLLGQPDRILMRSGDGHPQILPAPNQQSVHPQNQPTKLDETAQY
jgi:hypothetical protein